MYDNNYFKEVMGKQYKEDDLFENTYNKKNRDYVIITPNNNFKSTNNIISQNKIAKQNDIASQTEIARQNETVDYANLDNKNRENTIEQTANKVERKIIEPIKEAENEIKEPIINIENTIEKPIKEVESKIEEPIKKAENKVNEVGHEITKVSSNIKNDIYKLYPEIYKIINPMIEVAINRNKDKGITNEILEKIVNEIYYAIEGYEGNNIMLVSKNEESSILYDLVKILLLDKVANKMNNDDNTNRTNNDKNDLQKLANSKNNDKNDSQKIANSKNNSENQNNNLNQTNDFSVSNIPKVSYFDIPYPEDA